ncbi:MAG TPA: hypothetical protein VFS27_09170 [Blastocatellia bacterium]|jgi:hypothetical protein|nr:hypothetical protein [Blastocatellia bacterium]
MKYLFTITTLLLFTLNSPGQKTDAVFIQKQNLELNRLRTGDSTYIIYFKKTAEGPAQRMALVKINVAPAVINGKKAFAITQQWDAGDAVAHTSYTVHDAEDFSTLRHEIWWKQTGFSAKFDFMTRQIAFEAGVDESKKSQIVKDFNDSFESYNLCWHSDLTIFPLFPYENGRTFKVNFYDPGASKAQIAEYVVTGSETLSGGAGEKIDCWVMEYKSQSSNGNGSQRFWISKKTREVLKEEDQYPGGFRYKMKIGISGEK